MDLKFETSALEKYKDFINALRDAAPGSDDANQPLSGAVSWDGKISGPSGKPTFSGHVRGEHFQYSSILVDSLDGDLVYSPTELSLSRGHLRRGETSSSVEVKLDAYGLELSSRERVVRGRQPGKNFAGGITASGGMVLSGAWNVNGRISRAGNEERADDYRALRSGGRECLRVDF